MQKTRSDECLNRVKHWQLRTNGNLVRQILQRDLQLVALIVSEVANESLVDRLVAPELLAWGEALRLGATLALQGLVERCCATRGRVKCPLIATLQVS